MADAGPGLPDDEFEVAAVVAQLEAYRRMLDTAGLTRAVNWERAAAIVRSDGTAPALADRVVRALGSTQPDVDVRTEPLASDYYHGLRVGYGVHTASGVFVEAWAIRAAAEEAGLRLPDSVYANVAAALDAGKHLVLTGAPGSGKTTLALAVTRAAAQAGHAKGATVVTGAPAQSLVTEAARDGDPLARELLNEIGRWLGIGMADLAAALDPGTFIIGGGVSAAGDLLLDPAREAFRRQLTGRGYRPEAGIVVAELGNEAGLVGAADLARTDALLT